MTPDWRQENRAILRLAIPTLFSTLTVPLVTLADTIMVGHLPGAWPLAAVAMGGVAYGFLVTVLSPFRGLSIGLTGRWYGEGEPHKGTDWTLWGLVIALVAGGLMALAGPWLARAALLVFHAEGPLREAFTSYLSIRLWEVPLTVGQMFLLGHLRGHQRAWGPMAVTVAVALTNVAFNALLIYGLNLGVAGAAWGSVAANAVGFALALAAWFHGVRPQLDAARFLAHRSLLAALRHAFGWGVARSALLMGALTLFTAAASHLGAPTVAAHAVLMELWLLSSYAIDGFAVGVEALVAKRLGEGDRPRLRLDAGIGLAWCLAMGLAFSGLYALAGAPIVGLFTGEREVAQLALGTLLWVIWLQPMVAVSYWADGILNGAVDLKGAFWTLAAGAIACALVLPWSRHLGLGGVWLGLAAFSAARAAWALKVCWGYLRAPAIEGGRAGV